MHGLKSPFVFLPLATSALFLLGCDECKNSFDCGTAEICADGECKPLSSPADIQFDSDDQSGPSTSGSGSNDADTGDGCGDSYPVGPWKWDYNETVPKMSFPAIYGTDGEVDSLDMCEVFLKSREVKSLVFVVGADTCAGCPERFQQIGEIEDDVRKANAELVGLYYIDMTGTNKPLEDISRTMDSYGWSGGWRIQDNNSGIIWTSQGQGDWLVETTPSVFILRTATMQIEIAEDSYMPPIDVLKEVKALDELDTHQD